jgi:hypothetical protein
MKTCIKLYISCNKQWEVISATNQENTTITEDEYNQLYQKLKNEIFNIIPKPINTFAIHEFKKTEILPLYSFPICAGNYSVITPSSNELQFEIPMRIYVTKKNQDGEEYESIFEIAKHCLGYFKSLVSDKIPFGKQDFVFVPHLDMIAMENVGCITFDEKFLDQNQSRVEKDYFHSLISHELAHTWFGNLVTPEWWDDLWLNESFATFFSYEALIKLSQVEPEKMGRFQKFWLNFNRVQTEAIIHDQYSSTHKIRDEVEDTSHAVVKFNEITYSKGASIIKYLYYNIDEELRKKMIRNYLKTFEYGNANYQNFKDILTEFTASRHVESPLDIIEPFLSNRGIMRLEASINHYQGKINSIKFEQHPCEHAEKENYYNYWVDILLVYESSQVFEEKILLNFEGEKEGKSEDLNTIDENNKLNNSIDSVTGNSRSVVISNFKGSEEPLALILNPRNTAYFVQIFDENSLKFLIDKTYLVKNPITRLVIARDLSEMIKAGKLDVDTYLTFTMNLIKNESEEEIILQVLQTCIYNIKNFVKINHQINMKERLFNFIEKIYTGKENLHKPFLNFMMDLIVFESKIEEAQIILIIKLFEEKKESFIRMNSLNEEEKDELILSNYDYSKFDFNTKFRLLETIFESKAFTFEMKRKNLKNFIENYKDDASAEKESLEYFSDVLNEIYLPEKKTKIFYWNVIIEKSHPTYLMKEYELIMRALARQSQYILLREYFEEKFFKIFAYVRHNHGENYALLFLRTINPSFIVTNEILEKFEELQKQIRNGDYKLIEELKKSN